MQKPLLLLLSFLILGVRPYGAQAQTSHCGELLKRLGARATLPESALHKISKTREAIRQVTIRQNDSIDWLIEEASRNEKLKPGLRAALSLLQDPHYLADYITQLQEDTFRKMLASSDLGLEMMAKNGKLDRNVMLEVLRARAQRLGVSVHTINERLDIPTFHEQLGLGYIIDHGFPANSRHGSFTHLLQQDLTYGTIASVSGMKMEEVVKFFGTDAGVNVWYRMYDAQRISTTLSPEFFKTQIIDGNLPL